VALVRRVALDRLDQVRDQVVPALELNVDVGEPFIGPLLEANQAVEGGDHVDDRDHHDGEDDDDGDGH
jgi:hypothetical protein